MIDYPRHEITLGILAGGQGRRMQGIDKGLSMLAGQPQISHVLDRLQPQVDRVLINANRNLEQYRRFGYPVISDQSTDFNGPLAGIVALLEVVETPWLLICPCDTPDLPANLVARLYQAAKTHKASIAIAADGQHRHPVVALIHRSLASALSACLARGEHKIIGCYREHALIEVDFSDCPEAFINLNSTHERAYWLGLRAGRRARACNRHLGFTRPLLGICAQSGCGKTTLLRALLPKLSAAGLRVGVIKHAHESFDLDQPGKDSHDLRKAGARQTLVASNRRWALISEEPVAERPDLAHLLAQLDPTTLDLVLVEGFKRTAMTKLELLRPPVHLDPHYRDDADIVAVACPDGVALDSPPSRLDLDDIDEIAQFVIGFQQQAHKDLS